ncbi:MAG: hypothetical protein E7413_07760 [Ruminococcaceae bacterium]|nr:hypothetical protein [Oscillospiraceae bacterium]
MNKKFFSILMFLMMAVSLFPLATFANTMPLVDLRENYGAISVEAYNLGQGFLVEPSLYAKEGKSVGDITVEVLTKKNIGYTGDTSYFSGFEFDDTIEPQYPEYLQDYIWEFEGLGDGNGYLEEFDYSWMSGWCYTMNDWWASWGASDAYPGDAIVDYNSGETVILGDVIRWHFTIKGYGCDCGFANNVMAEWMGGNLFIQEDKSDLIFLLAAINDYYGNLDTDDVYETALAVAANPLASASELTEQETILTSYIEDTFFTATVSDFEITGYDGDFVYITFPEEGANITLILADYENDQLNLIKPIPLTTKKTSGENVMIVPIDSDITLSSNDKLMLWDGFTTCMPLCEAYIVN